MTARLVDSKCLGLAEHFLRDVKGAYGTEQQKLAEAIQEVCEDFCRDVEALEIIDPRDPDPSRPGIFRDHNCYRCKDGTQPCVKGNPNQCEYPHARND